jgi:hypothetical protein
MVLQVMSPATLAQYEQSQEQAAIKETTSPFASRLAGHIRGRFEMFRNHRSSTRGWETRLIKGLQAFNGEYDAKKLQQIRQFKGSEVYARLIGVKCRGATSLLRDVYLSNERPWTLDPTPSPSLPYDLYDNIEQLVTAEVAKMMQAGQQVDENTVIDRIANLKAAAFRTSVKRAREAAKRAEDALNDILVEGGFYDALAAFLVDLPMFPYACVKGPTVRVVSDMHWENGQPVVSMRPKMFWDRVSPFDLWWSPGVSNIADAEMIERVRLTRADLNAVMDLPGYDKEAIVRVLTDHGRGGLRDWIAPSDSDQALAESREDPNQNTSNLIDSLEYHGNVQGSLLLEYGLDINQINDPSRDYAVQAWLVGREVIKVQINPNPRKRHPYFVTSFEKMPGTVVGNALPDILEDVQDVANASLRALVNNLSIASGPQVIINDERMAPGADGEELYPWKRWHVVSDPTVTSGSNQKPVDFFQPKSNAQELLGVFKEMTNIADEISALPRYITGTERLGGAGRTASGLSLLMGNANKILQTVAANVDRDVVNPALMMLYDMVMLTDQSGLLRGDENVNVRGVSMALQKEAERQRRIEFLTATGNPVDLQIMGLRGRANVLREVAETLGMDGDKIVPDDGELAEKEKQQEAIAQAQAAGQMGKPGGAPPGTPVPGAEPPKNSTGNDAPKPKQLQGPRLNLMQPGASS